LLEAGRDLLDRLPERRVVLRSGDGLFQRLADWAAFPSRSPNRFATTWAADAAVLSVLVWKVET
jgi:hypothetical protein